MVDKYVNEWIVKINDITDFVISIRKTIKSKTLNISMLPIEGEYSQNEREMRMLGIIR